MKKIMLTYSTLCPPPVLTTYLSSHTQTSSWSLRILHPSLPFWAPIMWKSSVSQLTRIYCMLLHYYTASLLRHLPLSLCWNPPSGEMTETFSLCSDLVFTLLLEDVFFPACSVSHLTPRACSVSNHSYSCSELDMWPPHLSS